MVVRVEFYSIAASFTTVPGIPILIAGGYWARRQLHNGIRYVPVATKLRISLASVKRRHFVTESTIIATIHCPDIGCCLFRNPLVTHIPYHVPSLLL